MSSVSLPMPLVSGFSSFDEAPRVRVSRPAPSPAAPATVVAPATPAAPVLRETVEVDAVVPAQVDAGLLQSPSWSPASSGRVRAVEGAVIATLCGWFLYGGLAVIGWV